MSRKFAWMETAGMPLESLGFSGQLSHLSVSRHHAFAAAPSLSCANMIPVTCAHVILVTCRGWRWGWVGGRVFRRAVISGTDAGMSDLRGRKCGHAPWPHQNAKTETMLVGAVACSLPKTSSKPSAMELPIHFLVFQVQPSGLCSQRRAAKL